MNIFSYESKVTQIAMQVADLIILNLLYIVCCIPVFTIGAAQAGLFTGIRVYLDPEDDSPVYRAFFRGFSNGFGKITAVTVILGLLLAVLVFALTYALALVYAGGTKFFLIFCIAVMCIIYVVQCISGPFHATFGCTVKQLLMNSLFFVIGYPVRSILTAALILVPVAILMIDLSLFAGASIALLTLYYSVAYLIIFSLLKKPLNRLKESFYATQKAASDAEQIPAGTDQTERAEEDADQTEETDQADDLSEETEE